MATERSVVIFSQGTYGLPCTSMDGKRIILSEICLQHGGENLKIHQLFAGYFYWHFIQQ